MNCSNIKVMFIALPNLEAYYLSFNNFSLAILVVPVRLGWVAQSLSFSDPCNPTSKGA